jgi:hypothetical protein
MMLHKKRSLLYCGLELIFRSAFVYTYVNLKHYLCGMVNNDCILNGAIINQSYPLYGELYER